MYDHDVRIRVERGATGRPVVLCMVEPHHGGEPETWHAKDVVCDTNADAKRKAAMMFAARCVEMWLEKRVDGAAPVAVPNDDEPETEGEPTP